MENQAKKPLIIWRVIAILVLLLFFAIGFTCTQNRQEEEQQKIQKQKSTEEIGAFLFLY